ncbi:hypothetical protein O6H91_04G075500 [Diphasiastrum complanatum]|uniref:Uncharacterized protein n=1 Tax=Diphasiastrum complanatum TaxID=34168 RepID=A0ACC2DYL4_DIPCM|nr:hypothetical protein O6H91_04G075500 [Diphasiastrum complanatum]
MQAVMAVSSSVLLLRAPVLNLNAERTSLCGAAQRRCELVTERKVQRTNLQAQLRHRLRATPTEQEQYVDYNSENSVFPAEACEELGGEFCGVKGVGEEVKPKAAAAAEESAPPKPSAAAKDLEYLDYNSTDKTVFPGEACDELGGKFCEPEYQKGVFPEKTTTN